MKEKKLLALMPDGITKDLPDNGGTTMWAENATCPKSDSHETSGSSSKIYCYECGVWWWREGYGK